MTHTGRFAPRTPALVAGLLAVTLSLALIAGHTAAHVHFQGSDPVADSTVDTAPTTVTVQFDGEILEDGSTVMVNGPDGQRVDNGDGHMDLNNLDRNTVVCTLKLNLPPGVYTVDYTGAPSDGHEPNQGSYTFTIAGEAGAAATPAMAGTPAATAGATPAAPATPIAFTAGNGAGTEDGNGDWSVVIAAFGVIAALAAVAQVVFALTRRGRSEAWGD